MENSLLSAKTLLKNKKAEEDEFGKGAKFEIKIPERALKIKGVELG